MANVVAGQVIVEVIFAYPGIGTVLFQAIQASDYTVINGVVLLLIISIGMVTMLMDFLYPLLDPRISYGRQSEEGSAHRLSADHDGEGGSN